MLSALFISLQLFFACDGQNTLKDNAAQLRDAGQLTDAGNETTEICSSLIGEYTLALSWFPNYCNARPNGSGCAERT